MLFTLISWILTYTMTIIVQGTFVKTEALRLSDLIIIGFEFVLLLTLWFILFLRIFIEDVMDNFL